MDTNLLFALIGIGISVAGFFLGRTTAANNAGKRDGAIDAKLEYLSTGIKEIKEELKSANLSGIKTTIEEHSKHLSQHDDSIRRLHERIDDFAKGVC